MTDGKTYISITRKFDAPPEEVFRAWTTPEIFGKWFGTASTRVEAVSMDPKAGGDWKARMVLPDGNEIGWHGSYEEVEAPYRLVMTLSDRSGDQFELVTVQLARAGDGTEMTFTQSGGNMPPENYAQAEEGWKTFFDDLEAGLSA